MSTTPLATLARNDAALLSAAVSQHDGRIVLPETMTPLAAKRLIGRLLKQALVAPLADGAVGEHTLTPAGYAAVGMTPPPTPSASSQAEDAAAPKAVSKRVLVLALLSRTDGASLTELIAATGWLPHTTRAALSRLRSAGQVLAKGQRPDGATAYRILPQEPAPRGQAEGAPAGRNPARRKAAGARAAAAQAAAA